MQELQDFLLIADKITRTSRKTLKLGHRKLWKDNPLALMGKSGKPIKPTFVRLEGPDHEHQESNVTDFNKAGDGEAGEERPSIPRPDCPYSFLVALAFKNSSNGKLTEQDITNFIR